MTEDILAERTMHTDSLGQVRTRDGCLEKEET